jgi:hypothetical protein
MITTACQGTTQLSVSRTTELPAPLLCNIPYITNIVRVDIVENYIFHISDDPVTYRHGVSRVVEGITYQT